MKKPTKLTTPSGISMLVYGVPGAGKTTLLGSAPDTLIIRPPTDHVVSIPQPGNCEQIIAENWSDMHESYAYLHGGGHERHEWVWLDSVSMFQDFGLEDVFEDAVARKPSRAEYGPDKGEYGINMRRIWSWVRDMVALAESGRINFGITAHPFEWYDPVREETVWAPYVQGKEMSPKICGAMQIVAYLAVQGNEDEPDAERKRVLLTDSPGFVGKDQYNIFPTLKSGKRGIVDPTIPKVVDAVKKGRKPTTDRKRPAKKTARRRNRKDG